MGRRVTASGAYYVVFTDSLDEGAGSAALHVADGSELISHRIGGPSLTIMVGTSGRERFGSCVARSSPPRLAMGFLPILQTRYVDVRNVRYSQESFAARPSQGAPLTSFVRLSAGARYAHGDVQIRFAPDGRVFPVLARTLSSIFVAWAHAPPYSVRAVDRADYQAARASLVRSWQERLADGASVEVPERVVRNALRNLLIQDLGLGWRYSVGNPYEEFSYPESLDVAQVLAAYGLRDAAGAILRRSLRTARAPYANWRLGQKLVALAAHYRLFREPSLLADVTPDLRAGIDSVARQLRDSQGLLERQRYSSDIPDLVYGLHAQAVVWQGLREMARVWDATGERILASRCRRLANRLEAGVRRAVMRSSRVLPDASLFVPVRLLDHERPYRSVTDDRAGSYWNLVMPYALASGLFEPGSSEATGLLRYLLRHGSRLLGLVRAGAYSLYGRNARFPDSGVNPVYGMNVARFLADNHRAEQLVLSMYGQLAAGMAPGTFVAGEAASVAPLGNQPYRSMYLPPNAASNASFLETLRLMLVHEVRDASGGARGLELAFSTPRAWLAPGKTIAVRQLPTSFGPVSFSIVAREGIIRASIDVPTRLEPRTLLLRLRLPPGQRMARVSRDGRVHGAVDLASDTIDLSGLTGRLELVVRVVGPR